MKILTVNEKLKAPAELCFLGLEKDADCLPPTCDWLCKETGHSSFKRKHTSTTGYGNIKCAKLRSCHLFAEVKIICNHTIPYHTF
jgi:hypothetical protein